MMINYTFRCVTDAKIKKVLLPGKRFGDIFFDFSIFSNVTGLYDLQLFTLQLRY